MSSIPGIVTARRRPAAGFGRPVQVLLAALGLVLASQPVQVLAGLFTNSVVGSKHDLSAAAPGPIRSAGEGDVCIFCHTPHGGSSQAPLWNRFDSSAPYTPYSSTTMKASPVPDQPTGASKLCLSCHDGTVALGMVRSRAAEIPFVGGIDRMPAGRSNLGTDLSNDHPVSFVYDSTANGELQLDPSLIEEHVHLDRKGEVQCTSCHDPHHNDNGKFLVVENTESALCIACHKKNYWSDTNSVSIHRTSTWDGNGTDPWPHTEGTTVKANGCESCHTPHAAGKGERLLNFELAEDNCYSCHNSHMGAAKDIQGVFGKTYKHPIASTGGHDPLEDLVEPPTRHVTCVDCHNPHASAAAGATAPNASGALAGVAGVDATGSTIDPVKYEYELCFRCHGASSKKGEAYDPAYSPPTRDHPELNTIVEFDTGNKSFHPIEAIGKNTDVPSLKGPTWTENSRVYCTDCHNNNDGPGAGGGGPNGPHGSIYEPLLELNLNTSDGPYGTAEYALCYKCHSENSIQNNESFSEHYRHVWTAGTACSTCHDPHGVQDNEHLINFRTGGADPVSGVATNGNRLEYSLDATEGTCYLDCHGVSHNPKKYTRP